MLAWLTILSAAGPDFNIKERQDTWQPTVDGGGYRVGSQLGARTLYASLNTSGLTGDARSDWSENGNNLRDAILS